jgi:hypothetical protein
MKSSCLALGKIAHSPLSEVEGDLLADAAAAMAGKMPFRKLEYLCHEFSTRVVGQLMLPHFFLSMLTACPPRIASKIFSCVFPESLCATGSAVMHVQSHQKAAGGDKWRF